MIESGFPIPTGFDHAAFHRETRRLYVAHTANDALDIIDLDTGRYVRSFEPIASSPRRWRNRMLSPVVVRNRMHRPTIVFYGWSNGQKEGVDADEENDSEGSDGRP